MKQESLFLGECQSGDPFVKVDVSYENTGAKDKTFSSAQWDVFDAQGAECSIGIYMSPEGDIAPSALDTGSLTAGGSKQGTIYVKADAASKVSFTENFYGDADASWNVA